MNSLFLHSTFKKGLFYKFIIEINNSGLNYIINKKIVKYYKVFKNENNLKIVI